MAQTDNKLITALSVFLLLILFLLPGCGVKEAAVEEQTIADIDVEISEPQPTETPEPVKMIRALKSVRIVSESDFFTYEGDDTYSIEYDDEGRILRADSQIYSYWEKCIYPQFIYGTVIPGIDEYEYNDEGSVLKVTRKSEDGSVRFSVDYEYDDEGKLILETMKNGDAVLTDSYEYDEDGSLVSVERDLGNRKVTVLASYSDSGTFTGLRYKEKIDQLDYNRSAKASRNKDGDIIQIELGSGYSTDESAVYKFLYNAGGELSEVTFKQGYYNTAYTLTYNYGEITVKDQ